MGMEFVFINVKEPKDALQLAKEPEIRSHVARYQWKQAENRPSLKRKRNAVVSICMGADCCPAWQPRSDSETDFHDSSGHSSTLPFPFQLGGLRVDPFRSYPIDFRPFVPVLVDHYLMDMAVDIPELDLPGNKGLLRTSWFPLVMSEPALFLVIMLLAASHYASLNEHTADMKINLLSLRCEAVQAINDSLKYQRPDRVSDALVGAIAKMGSYEAMFGNIDNYSVHMKGLTRAVGLRGGLTALGLNGLLRRIVVWIDRNAAFLHGSTLYFPGATFVPGQALPDPNPGHFLASS
ncbi:hypothetical protein ETB97_001377 [Aspergillus alliaceus]|uniref:Uncharacterized protein n=1 Tax=Petromyces alliaceus TaxID=209559 RepID=A0A5N6G6N2_PETAA|nr:uncharacterized protein BDW43DRAFT_265419 [Aspergillus alliaceus]KAB8237407.1 hypothetical protein BDW43DRAFT_265419 [Aspergillus alliaceus]KAF5860534.1 hypothetical protein ETB97_001377 [Aspergillus burnettii]